MGPETGATFTGSTGLAALCNKRKIGGSEDSCEVYVFVAAEFTPLECRPT